MSSKLCVHQPNHARTDQYVSGPLWEAFILKTSERRVYIFFLNNLYLFLVIPLSPHLIGDSMNSQVHQRMRCTLPV